MFPLLSSAHLTPFQRQSEEVPMEEDAFNNTVVPAAGEEGTRRLLVENPCAVWLVLAASPYFQFCVASEWPTNATMND